MAAKPATAPMNSQELVLLAVGRGFVIDPPAPGERCLSEMLRATGLLEKSR
jgi:hypothetical protein